MDCKELELMLDLIIDGEISQEEKEKALSHIEVCEKCKKEYEKAVELKNSFKGFVEKKEKSLADSVVAEIRKEKYGTKKTPFLMRHIGLVASLVFIVAIALYSGALRDDSDMYISEESASVTEAPGFVADIKNSANIERDDVYFTSSEVLSDKIQSDIKKSEVVYDTCTKPFAPGEAMTEATPEEAPEMPMAENEAVKSETESAVVKILCDPEKALPLLLDFEIIEYGVDYIVVNAKDKEEIEKIIEN